MPKVVYNKSPGAFGLSHLARHYYLSGCETLTEEYDEEELDVCALVRHDPLLVKCVEDLRAEANGKYANLGIKEVPGEYRIEVSPDGMEQVVMLKNIDPARLEAHKRLREEVREAFLRIPANAPFEEMAPDEWQAYREKCQEYQMNAVAALDEALGIDSLWPLKR